MVKSLFPAHVETQWKYLDFMEILFIAALKSRESIFHFFFHLLKGLSLLKSEKSAIYGSRTVCIKG